MICIWEFHECGSSRKSILREVKFTYSVKRADCLWFPIISKEPLWTLRCKQDHEYVTHCANQSEGKAKVEPVFVPVKVVQTGNSKCNRINGVQKTYRYRLVFRFEQLKKPDIAHVVFQLAEAHQSKASKPHRVDRYEHYSELTNDVDGTEYSHSLPAAPLIRQLKQKESC